MSATTKKMTKCPECEKFYDEAKFVPFQCVSCGLELSKVDIPTGLDYTALLNGASFEKLPSFQARVISKSLGEKDSAQVLVEYRKTLPDITTEELKVLLRQGPEYFARQITDVELLSLSEDLELGLKELLFTRTDHQTRGAILERCIAIGDLAKSTKDTISKIGELYSDVPRKKIRPVDATPGNEKRN
jgi:hypothetical protein